VTRLLVSDGIIDRQRGAVLDRLRTANSSN
jgi:hypothetical protein